jgi:hypothetical protein
MRTRVQHQSLQEGLGAAAVKAGIELSFLIEPVFCVHFSLIEKKHHKPCVGKRGDISCLPKSSIVMNTGAGLPGLEGVRD